MSRTVQKKKSKRKVKSKGKPISGKVPSLPVCFLCGKLARMNLFGHKICGQTDCYDAVMAGNIEGYETTAEREARRLRA